MPRPLPTTIPDKAERRSLAEKGSIASKNGWAQMTAEQRSGKSSLTISNGNKFATPWNPVPHRRTKDEFPSVGWRIGAGSSMASPASHDKADEYSVERFYAMSIATNDKLLRCVDAELTPLAATLARLVG